MKNLIQYKQLIVQKWLEAALEGYQPETALFLKTNIDPFKNPAGSILKKSIESLASQVLEGMDHDTISRALTDILSIRAVQDFSPSEAVGFIPALRGIVREVAGGDAATQLEARIDELLLMAFDIYMERREKIFGIRIRELRSGVFNAAEGTE
jgi:hypothetical protein